MTGRTATTGPETQADLTESEPPHTDAPTQHTPDYILDACQAAGEWWARSDKDPRIKFQPAVIAKLLDGIRDGLAYEPACHWAGVSYRQFRDWMNRGEDDGPDTPFGRVAAAVKVAEAEAERGMVRAMRKAGEDPRFWAANARILESRHPERWLRVEKQVNVQVGVALGLQVTDEQRRGLVPSLSPAPDRLIASSPVPQIAVTVARPEAKATPIGGVSPADVA